ncbi:MAG TPA: cytochrome c peroxidase [Agriterribacter sp.]|nr:cytochrome c peroxidase [Agriterribacter sp.]
MRSVCGTLCFCLFLVLIGGFNNPSPPAVGVERAVLFIKAQSEKFASSAMQLQTAIAAIQEQDPGTISNARGALKNCRLNYKKIEFFLEYFFKSSALIYNMPPKAEIEEPYMEYQEPIGLQVIEALLFEKNVEARKSELLQQVDAVSSSAKDLNALLYGFNADDKQLFESIRLQLIRIITLGITGFDAPLLKSGIAEAHASLCAVQEVLLPFLGAGTMQGDSVSKYLSCSIRFLQLHPDFDSFDRLTFLTQHALPLQRHLNLLTKELNLEHNTTGGILNYEAGDIFSHDALDIHSFPAANRSSDVSRVWLGKKLFFEPGLSGNNKMSCATCHNPAKHFTDALPKSIAFDGHSQLRRNAPSLLYAGFQHEQFWDGRAKSLEEQIGSVISDPLEMNGSSSAILSMLKRNPEYLELFDGAIPEQSDSITILNTIAASIAAFVNSLNPRNSRFDKYIEDTSSTLTPGEIRGFNLFMGKALCGTCHFAPLFNGLVPPLYNRSEVEVLGTPKSDNLDKPELDTDRGRFDVFPMEFYEGAFKTPSVRNVSATGPYMHNGSFKTLEAVLEFYNKGGGNGLGLPVKNQTLSAEPLNLSENEMGDVVAFLHALEDSVTIQQYSNNN